MSAGLTDPRRGEVWRYELTEVGWMWDRLSLRERLRPSNGKSTRLSRISALASPRLTAIGELFVRWTR